MEIPTTSVETETFLTNSTFASFFLLDNLECPTAVELLEQNPAMSDEEWLRLTGLLEEKGIERGHVGFLLALYPHLADAAATAALDISETQWLNNTVGAVLQIKATTPQIYYGHYVVDDTKKFTNLALVGQKITEGQVLRSEEEVLAQIIEKPELFAARPLKVKVGDRLRQMHLDPDLLDYTQTELFNERIMALDKEAPDYMACLSMYSTK
jgi:hypothetical protein